MDDQPSWSRIWATFEETLKRPQDQRQAWIIQACGEDAALREQVEKLLAAHEKDAGVPDRSVAGLASEGLSDPAAPVPDQQLGPYRIVSELGRGGMGIVYKAQDTRLDRTVALKFLHSRFVVDEDLRKRFDREAKAAAGLNHQNICTIYEINEIDGRTFIAMAYLEGESLAKKIEQGPLKLTEVLDISLQVAEGLQEAHSQNIVHRDIKPANIMLTPKDRSKPLVTIMDFGLAQLANLSKLTRGGTILGTPTYMSPEQAQGQVTDFHTDIWSLGIVLYEMVIGQSPFRGEYDQAVLYAINNEPAEPITSRRTGVPLELEWIVEKCLAKDPNERYQNAADLIVDLRVLRKKLDTGKSTGPRALEGSLLAGPGSSAPQTVLSGMEKEAGGKPGGRLALFGWLVAALLSLVLLALWQGVRRSGTSHELPLRRYSFAPPGGASEPRVSPDGRFLVYVQPNLGPLWVQPLGRENPFQVEGSAGARGPSWSPDSNSLAFVIGKQLLKSTLGQGRPVAICDLPEEGFAGGAWSPDGTAIAFCIMRRGIYEVSAQGGQPRLVIENGRYSHTESVSYLPSKKRALLFAAYVREAEQHEVVVHSLEEGTSLVAAASQSAHPEPAYSPTGHIIYTATSSITPPLRSLPFSLESLQVTGEAFDIDRSARSPSVAEDGTLVFLDPGEVIGESLIWKARSGKKQDTVGQPHEHPIYQLRLSPQDRRVAVSAWTGSGYDLWIHEAARAVKSRFTFDAEASAPVWSPTGEHVSYVTQRDGFHLWLQLADGSEEADLLLTSPHSLIAEDWSPDGKRLLYTSRDPQNGRDLWFLSFIEGLRDYQAVPFLRSRFHEQTPAISPDGQYVAYSSDESGEYEIYVRPFQQGRGKWRISPNGGVQPRWSANGRELFYVAEQTLMAVPITVEPTFGAGLPSPLFEDPNLRARLGPFTAFDVSADATRFLMIETQRDVSLPVVRLVQNWFVEFRGRGGPR